MSPRTVANLSRWIIGVAMITKGAAMLVKSAAGSSDGGYAGAMAYALLSFALIILGLLLIARDITQWITTPIWRFISGIIFPDEKFERPRVNYALPRGYRQRFRPEDAIEHYLDIIRHHPQELDAYLECMEVMIETGDREGVERLLATARKKLRSAAARKQVAAHHASLTTPKPVTD